MSFVPCSKLNAEVAALQSQIDDLETSLAAAAVPDATDAAKGKVELATSIETGNGQDGTRAVTPAGLATALNDAAGPNALQEAVVNAFEQAIATDPGAQAAISAAIKDDLAADSSFVDLVAAGLSFEDCNGDPIVAGAALATCSNLNDAIADATSGGVAPAGAAGGALTGTYPNPGLSAAAVVNAVESGIAADTGAQAAIAAAIADDIVATTAFTDALDAAIAAIPGDKFLQGLQSYDAATNTMVLAMNDGTTVSIDMTALVNDAAGSASIGAATTTAAGIVELATSAEVVTGTSTTLATTPAGVAAAISAAFASPGGAQAIVAGIVADPTALQALADALAEIMPDVFE